MKRILLPLVALALFFTAAFPARAGIDVSLDFFYTNLNDGGSWIEVGDYGYCWQPDIAVSDSRWRPYADGYWAYTDVGWTWVSYEDFGWATYHYGRWARLREQGWVWVPGREWGPAWVSWRTGGDYVGWAPLPPRYDRGRGVEVVYEGRAVSSTVDIDFDIGPAYYNFVDVRYIGEPVLRERIFESTQNITYINRTVNVTNITYNDSRVYNYGPDYNRLSAYSTRPIRRMTLERQANVGFDAATQAGGVTRVQGDRLIVASPPVVAQRADSERIAPPKRIKNRIAKPDLETGWMGISDPKAKADLQQKIKKEDSKSVPPPQVQPTNPALLTATPDAAATVPPATGAATPELTATPAPAAAGSSSPAISPDEQGRKGNRRGGPEASPQPGASSSPDEKKRGRNGKRRGPNDQMDAQPSPAAADAVSVPNASATPAVPPNENSKEKRREKRGDRNPTASPVAVPAEVVTPETSAATGVPAATPSPIASPEKNRGRNGKRRGPNDQMDAQPSPVTNTVAVPNATGVPAVPPNENNKEKRREKRGDQNSATSPIGAPPTVVALPETTVAPVQPSDDRRGRGRRDERRAPAVEAPSPDSSDDGAGLRRRGGDRAVRAPEIPPTPVDEEAPPVNRRGRERAAVPPPSDAGAVAPVPVSDQPRRGERQGRQPVPPQGVPHTAPADAPSAPQGSGDKSDRPKKGKKGQDEPVPTPSP